MSLHEWAGRSLGTRTVSYDESDAILYALAIGASEEQLDLVFEDQLRVLPTFALTLAQWAPDALAVEGVFDHRSMHGSQTLEVHKSLPRSGEITLTARVGNIWDKGSAAICEVVIDSDYFTATWSIFCPGHGGFGGERGPSVAQPDAAAAKAAATPTITEVAFPTFATQAALYRLTGDRHHIHIDPAASAAIGQPKPILQGMCTLAAATLPLAQALGAHPADLRSLSGRFSGPVVPGQQLTIRVSDTGAFDAVYGETTVISGGAVSFS
ncbi:acyl dehydratase [Leucobacter exalbidus]|uniref:Acyl dehydratase n=1 Tax=Leucobacter exalbidus TaxID=662960 RepID=A0A940PMS4_9MICO|nr:MaoC/PaaZ C-terminal domain-containing protein [Leucobacter exalbidus]MBP1325960.1 acyl dehydratase [Leucobacter exalbidus]